MADKRGKQVAIDACESGFKEGVEKMVETENKQALKRFQNGLGLYKDAYNNAQQAIDAVYSEYL